MPRGLRIGFPISTYTLGAALGSVSVVGVDAALAVVAGASAASTPTSPVLSFAEPGPGAGQASIEWNLPSFFADGSPIEAGDLHSLVLYHGPNEGQQFAGGTGTTPVVISDPTDTEIVLSSLPSGLTYVAISARIGTGPGDEGDVSNEMSFTVVA